ncbi:MAG: hypothetical protein ACI9SP_002417 [Arenicella sp.]|jgi:hypothetical protein
MDGLRDSLSANTIYILIKLVDATMLFRFELSIFNRRSNICLVNLCYLPLTGHLVWYRG